MAKRRHSPKDEILMVPFLDILCSLIGILVLIIVFLVVSEANQTEGRTKEEIDRATDYKKMKRQTVENEKIEEQAKGKLEKLERLIKELDDKEQKLARIRMLQSATADSKKLNESMSQDALKELDNLLLEIKGYQRQSEEIKKEMAALLAEIDKRKPPANVPPPPVIVQPGGSGLAMGTKAFFVEASSGAITLYWDAERKTLVGATPEVIVASSPFNQFLKAAKAVPNAKLIFLVRDDGGPAYDNAAGWALQTHGFSPAQVAKLPIPGRGAIDLQMFKGFLGRIEPPPGVTLVPVPAKTTP